MGFFDLNIPYLESSKPVPQNQTLKQSRLKLTIKTMQLGYTGVAYTRTVKGVMSDSDFCSIPLFSPPSILKLSPYLSSSVKLHRELLKVPVTSPFRQYTRLTVVVDSVAQNAALNSGNPVLKSYNVVAVKPLNQQAFDHACQFSEVDIIAIDFLARLPFRLKLPMIKAAIQRGVYFEITYSGLVADVQTRRQVISNAKLLVDWTRGKNIIFSSAASSAAELRGPYDVANLASLLGISMERAKAALSKNCRDLIAKALRKRQYFKEAIKVEPLAPGEQLDFKQPSFSEWDPISSGEGDLSLDDLAASSSICNKETKTVKAIDFASIMDSLPSHGLRVKDLMNETDPLPMQTVGNGKNFSAAKMCDVSVETSDPLSLPISNATPVIGTPSSQQQASVAEESEKPILTGSTPEIHTMEELTTRATTIREEDKNLNELYSDFGPGEKEIHMELQLRSFTEETFHTAGMDIELDTAHNSDNFGSSDGNNSNFPLGEREISGSSDAVLEEEHSEVGERVLFSSSNVSSQSSYLDVGAKYVKADEINPAEPVLPSSDGSLPDYELETRKVDDMEDEGLLNDGRPLIEPCQKVKGEGSPSIADHEPKELTMEEQKHRDHPETLYLASDDSAEGKSRGKQRMPNRAVPFPFKPLLNPTTFKKKRRKSKK